MQRNIHLYNSVINESKKVILKTKQSCIFPLYPHHEGKAETERGQTGKTVHKVYTV